MLSVLLDRTLVMALTPANLFVVVVKAWLNDKDESNENRAATDVRDFMVAIFVRRDTRHPTRGDSGGKKKVEGDASRASQVEVSFRAKPPSLPFRAPLLITVPVDLCAKNERFFAWGASAEQWHVTCILISIFLSVPNVTRAHRKHFHLCVFASG